MESVKLKNIVKLKKGKKVASFGAECVDGCRRYIQIDDLRNDLNIKYTSSDGVEVKNSDVLIAWDGANAGTVGYGISGVAGSTISCLEIVEREFETAFVGKFLQSKFKLIRANCTGATIPHVSRDYLLNLTIPHKPLEEQKKIVQVLDTADNLRQKRKEQLSLLDDYLKSVFIDMFGDPVRNEKGWGEKPLSSFLEFLTSGSRGWAKHYSDNGGKFLRIQNVGLGKILLDDIAYVVTPAGAEAKRTRVQSDDVLMSITADLGRACVVPSDIGEAYINQHLSILRLKQGLNPYYLSYYIVSDGGRLKLLQKNKGGVKAGLNFNDIKSFLVFLPPLDLQNKFASIVEQVEQVKQKMRVSLDEMDNHFNALMLRCFG